MRRVLPSGPHDFSHGPDAGDLAPSVEIKGKDCATIRLLDILRGPHHTLVLFVGTDGTGQTNAWRASVAVLRHRYDATIEFVLVTPGDSRDFDAQDFDGHVLHDTEGKIHRRYGAQSPCLYLVRPDKYIAYRCQPVDFERLIAYLDRVLVAKA